VVSADQGQRPLGSWGDWARSVSTSRVKLIKGRENGDVFLLAVASEPSRQRGIDGHLAGKGQGLQAG
jgi:hypothetical protein